MIDFLFIAALTTEMAKVKAITTAINPRADTWTEPDDG
ncbi:hypothetical protein L910_1405 [Vibrio fluvialis PG41]|uniref:Uncharacterized protein n=1 Tax=Vibrio fluvialis PG41 TaxID=1336752 RepID=S7I033_VIBFL|nr:hypothetical protein L910_1405 [Vibrio fluvialis PG41]